MIKSLSLLTRKSTLSKEEFRRIWLGEHAPLVHAVPQVRKYVLSFILGEPTRPDVPTQAMSVDAVAELWYDDMDFHEGGSCIAADEGRDRQRRAAPRRHQDVHHGGGCDHLSVSFATGGRSQPCRAFHDRRSDYLSSASAP